MKVFRIWDPRRQRCAIKREEALRAELCAWILGRPLKGDPSGPYLWLSLKGTLLRGSISPRIPLTVIPIGGAVETETEEAF